MSLPKLYKYTSYENGLRSIQNQKFKWSSILQFNDPFESRFHVEQDIGTKVRLAALAASIKGGFFLPPETKQLFVEAETKSKQEFTKIIKLSDDIDRTIKKHKTFTQELYFDIERTIWNATKSSSLLKALYDDSLDFRGMAHKMVANEYGILCLSESCNNPLMWGHYANDHKGIMFEFDFEKIPRDSKLHESIRKVHYQEEYPEMGYETLLGLNNSIFPELSPTFMKTLAFTKQKAWEYEMEYRSFASNSALDENKLSTIPKICFTSITLGCSMKDENMNQALELTKTHLPSCDIYLNQLSSKSYSLNRVLA